MTPTEPQLRWMRAIHQFYSTDQWYPGLDDLLEVMGYSPAGSNGAMEMMERLERLGLVEWPLNKKRPRSQAKSDRLCRRANSIRLTPLGLSVLKENS